jgi:phospholipase/lecithinase/hemolysin
MFLNRQIQDWKGPMKIVRVTAAASLALSAMLFGNAAKAYDELVVFGDSLSDNGNLYRSIFQILPTKPYFNGRFTNGPVAVEVMAQALDIPLVNYAFGGATSGANNQYIDGSFTGLFGQISGFLMQRPAGQPVDADDLYIVWGGGNDLLSAITDGTSGGGIQPVIDLTVSNLVNNVKTLYGAGARDVMVPLMPDMATSYYGTSGQYSKALLSDISGTFNDALQQEMWALQAASPGLTLRIFDTPGVLAGVRADMAAAGGNMTDRCWTGEFIGRGTLCTNPDSYYLFDRVHPTAVVHRAFGEAMAAAVPEPGALAMLMGGALAVGWHMRRTNRHGGLPASN